MYLSGLTAKLKRNKTEIDPFPNNQLKCHLAVLEGERF